MWLLTIGLILAIILVSILAIKRNQAELTFDFYDWVAEISIKTEMVVKGYHDWKGTRITVYSEPGKKEKQIIDEAVKWAADHGTSVTVKIKA